MAILLKRAYDKPSAEDGKRVLVERLWPRGLKKDQAKIDQWPKELAPSTELRKWYNHDPEKWNEFKRRYWKELEAHKEALAELAQESKTDKVTFVFASKEEKLNNAVALKEYIENKLDREPDWTKIEKPLTEQEITEALKQLPSWRHTGNCIERGFTFDSFMEAIGFINRVAQVAEAENHHPNITLEKISHVKIALTTFCTGKLSKLDFVLASKIDQISKQQ